MERHDPSPDFPVLAVIGGAAAGVGGVNSVNSARRRFAMYSSIMSFALYTG